MHFKHSQNQNSILIDSLWIVARDQWLVALKIKEQVSCWKKPA